MPAPTIETLAIAESVVISRKPSSRTIGSRMRLVFARSPRVMVKLRSVVPWWPTFWTIVSTLTPASASGAKTAWATPGRSGTSTRVTLATLRSWASPRTLLRCSTNGSSLMSVPGTSSNELSTSMTTLLTQPSSTARTCITWAPWWASSIISSYEMTGSWRASGTRRGSAV